MSELFLDVDTQLDFLYPAGALYVPGAESIVPALAHLNRMAAQRGIPVISTVDAHTENDPEFAVWPKHCIAGAFGQQKSAGTLLARRVTIPNRACHLEIEGAEQIVVEKQTVDVFQSLHLAALLRRLEADRVVVYGVVTEICVQYAAMGLLKLGKRVTVVADAIRSLSDAASAAALDKMRAAGATIATTGEV